LIIGKICRDGWIVMMEFCKERNGKNPSKNGIIRG
jgi:hypothetical protein